MAKLVPEKFRKAVSSTWNDYPDGTRGLFTASIVIGAVLVIAAVVLDLLGMWPHWTFLPNLVNSLAGFFIGVPVALVLLETLTNERENNKIERLSCAAWTDFADRVRAFCSDARIRALDDAEQKLAELWRAIRDELLTYMPEHSKAIVHLPKDETYTAFQERMKRWCQQMTNQCTSIDKAVGNAASLEPEWLAIRRSWTLLDVMVKVQRIGADLEWLPDDIDTGLQIKMERGGNPIAAFSDAHDKKARYQEFPPMGDVPHWICKRSRDGRHDFAQWIAGSPHSAPFTLDADTYKSHAVHARMFLEELRALVDAAEDGDEWPASCNIPTDEQKLC